MQSKYLLLPAVIALSLYSVAADPVFAFEQTPPLVLAENYHENIDLSRYWVSEKYDGARAWWNGKNFISRGGGIYRAPKWFTANLPAQVLDGELWIGRNQFQPLMQTIRDTVPDDEAWRAVKFMVFDAPHTIGNFNSRQQHIANLLSNVSDPWVKHVSQTRVLSHADLHAQLELITKQGAEGLMLQREDMGYLSGRHYGLVKLKLHTDAEARVLAHLPGKGKYTNMMGSILVETSNGIRFKLGSGFTDHERKHPPALGSLVTYRYQGITQSGKPRFARFLRLRPEQ